MFNDQQAISAGTTQSPYVQNSFTIAAGQYVDVFVVFNYFRVMSLSGGTLKLMFGQNGLETSYVGAGVGLKFDFTYDRVRLVNSHATDSMTITVAVALGAINDDRLNVSGTVTVAGAVTITSGSVAQTAASDIATSQVTVNDTADQLVTASATNNYVIIKAGDEDMWIGKTSGVTTATGFKISAGDAIALQTVTDVYGIRDTGISATAYVLRGII